MIDYGLIVLLVLRLLPKLSHDLVLLLLDLRDEIRQHAKRVRARVSKKYLVLIELKGVVPAHLVVNARPWILLCGSLTDLADAVLDVVAAELPSQAHVPRFLQRKDLDWHALQIERVPFGHIDHIYPDLSALNSIFNSKIKPLKITRSVCIRPQKHIIAIKLFTFDNRIKITALKVCIKRQKSVLLLHRYGFIDLLALRIHASLLNLTGLLLWVPLPKYLLQQSIIVVLAANVVLRKVELVAARPVVQVLIRVSLVHLVRVVEAFLLVD